jgi:hypothetical protein
MNINDKAPWKRSERTIKDFIFSIQTTGVIRNKLFRTDNNLKM